MRAVSSLRAVNKKCTMRFLIVATAVFACAAAAPSGAVLAAPYSVPYAPVAPVARLAPALPTISAGDINGAAIDAHVEATDHLRAAVDANRQLNDKVKELHGQAVNNAQEQAWREVDAVKTVEARLDGAAAGAAPVIAKSLVRSGAVAPVPYSAPVPYAANAAPVAIDAQAAYSAPVGYASSPVAYAAPFGYEAQAAYSAPVSYAPAPVSYAAAPVSYAAAPVSYAAAPVSYATAPVSYAAAPVSYGAPIAYDAPIAYNAPLAYTATLPESKTVVSQYLAQTHPVTYNASPFTYAQAW